MGRTLDKHPDLKLFGYTEKTLQAETEIAVQRPPIVVGLRMQNALGTHETTGFKNAEIALTLASVLERGGKRDARQALSAGQLDALGAARETKRLDLLAEVARRYLDVVAAQTEATIAATDVAQRERTVAAATKRVQAGASPESARLTAEALQARAQIDRARANRNAAAAYRRLAILWNDRDPVPTRVAGNIQSLPEVPDFNVLAALLEATPDLKRFADEARIREARLQLARSARAPDINWEVGVQRLQDFGSSWGVIAGVTVPLGASHRAEPEVRAAENERQALALERESSELALYATLAQAYGQYVTGKAEAEACRDELLPRLARAEAAAERAYRAGALSYLEWAQVQSETTAVHKQQLAAAIEAQRALIEIQRLTGDPFINAAFKDPAP
jgi:cobalt-zinc-cadmium efflux system outer membrane protein